MANFEVNAHDFEIKVEKLTNEMLDAAEKAINDAMDDLVTISSNIAPIDKDVLRKSHIRTVKRNAKGIIGEVAYSVAETSKKYGRFNYALAMHEWIYKPSRQGSYAGYTVGRKYLERPLFQEAPKWNKWIADDIKDAAQRGTS